MPGLGIDLSREGRTAVLRLRGELDLATGAELERRLDELLDPTQGLAVHRLEVDTAAVDFMDLAGLRVLLRARDRLASRDAVLVLRACSRPVQRLLTLLDLSEALGPDDPPGPQNSVGVSDSRPRSSS